MTKKQIQAYKNRQRAKSLAERNTLRRFQDMANLRRAVGKRQAPLIKTIKMNISRGNVKMANKRINQFVKNIQARKNTSEGAKNYLLGLAYAEFSDKKGFTNKKLLEALKESKDLDFLQAQLDYITATYPDDENLKDKARQLHADNESKLAEFYEANRNEIRKGRYSEISRKFFGIIEGLQDLYL